jgi:integrase
MQVRLSVTEVAIDENIELKSGHWREENLVRGPPKGGERTVPLPLHLVDSLRELTADRPRSALVTESERGMVLRVRTFRQKTDWTKLVADLGFDGFRIHDLRATAVTNLLAAGVPPHVVRDIGHKDLQVTSLYAQAHDDALSLAAALMACQGRA